MKVDYGIDAPGVVRNFILIAAGGFVLAAVAHFFIRAEAPGLAKSFEAMGTWGGGYCLFTAAVMVWGKQGGQTTAARSHPGLDGIARR